MKLLDRFLKARWLWFILAVAWMIMMFWLLTQPGSYFSGFKFFRFPGADKLVHCILFSVSGFLWMLALGNTVWRGIFLALLLFGFGYTTEWLQSWIPGRTRSILDLYANMAGTVLGVSVAWVTQHMLISKLLAAKQRE